MRTPRPRKRGRPPKHAIKTLASLAENSLVYGDPMVGGTARRLAGPANEILSPNQAGRELGLTGEAIKNWIYTRRLRAVKLRNGYWRIRRGDLIASLEQVSELSLRVALIVDEDPTFLSVAQKLLTDTGFEMRVTATGIDALEILSHQPPDLIIIGTGFREGAGLVIAEEIRTMGKSDAPIIFTGPPLTKANDLMAIVRVKAKAYITSPVTPEQLRKEILNAINVLK